MRSRSKDKEADPAFLDERTVRKQAERQVLLDALSGRLETEAIEWTADSLDALLQDQAERLQK